MSIQVQNLTKYFGSQKAVDNISFEANEGEILGFLGPNGAGKSTTMKIATAYLPPSEGSVKICGYDVDKSSIEVRKNVGYLPEHNPLYLDMYVKEYLTFIASLHKIKETKAKKRTEEMIELVGLTREQKKKIGALSKGYRQRVGLAQALIHNPKVLILDEPTTGLDPNQIVEIREVIRSISKDKTVIFSTHIMQEVQALCSRVIIIKLGQIVADNAVEKLQNSSGQTCIEVEFESAISETELSNFPLVEEVKLLQNNHFQLFTSSEKDIRGDIFRAAVEKGWVIVGMSQTKASLENIFQDLTQ